MTGTDSVSIKTVASVSKATCLLLLLAFLGWPCQPMAARAQTTTANRIVADVIVSGNRSVPTAEILNHLRTRKDKEYKLSLLEDDVRKLTALGLFRNVNVREHTTTDNRVVVEFMVEEHPNVVQAVVIKNNRHESLDEVLTLKRITRGSPLNPALNRQAANEIEDYYRSKGYMFATVKLEEGDKPGDRQVVFNVTEGPKVKIGSVRFVGNEELASSARLRTQITGKAALLKMIGGTFNPAIVEEDVRKLEQYYRDNGYLDARVSREIIPSSDLRYVDIVYHINEGVRYHVQNVTVEGLKNLPKEQVESILRTRKGELFNGFKVEADTRNVIDAHGWRGYRVNVRPELYYPEPGLVHVHYQVVDEQRPPARVGQIQIIGNDRTKDRVIRRMLNLYPGQILRYPELRLAEQNLARSQLFEVKPELGIRPTIMVQDDPTNTSEYKNIIVKVDETTTGAFMLGVGVSSNSGLIGSIVLNERNFDLFRPPTSLEDVFEGRAFRGGGQEMRLEAVPGTELQRYSITFREPFLFDRPYSLTWAGYYYDRVFNEYTQRRVGTRVTVGHQFNEFWSISGGLRLEGVGVDDVPFFAPVDYTSVQGDNFLVAPRVALVRDSRDSFLRPTEGNRVELSYEQVFGDFTYPVFNVEGSQYYTAFQRRDGSGKQVLAAHAQFSWAGDDVPVYDRFFAGGYQSLRGFQFRGVGPEVNGFKVGGNFMLLASMEYQIPLLANDQLYFVTFVDTGTVEQGVKITDYRVSAGFGLRIVVPMMGPVPIALDFGFPIVQGPHDNEQVFSFYVGLFN